MKLKLKEIIWEITDNCNHNCHYCWNKGQIFTIPDEEEIIKIAQAICEYPPEEINISGGDPLLISIETHETIVKLFRENFIIPKIIVNPKSLKSKDSKKILNLYEGVGISLNTIEDINIYNDNRITGNNRTFITNFNLSNIFDFEKISKTVGTRPWQIQGTVYKDPKNPMSIYNNDSALVYLKEMIEKNNGNIMIGDNLNSLECTAGINTCGILCDGTVVGCLSQRTWKAEITGMNILEWGLEVIWESSFKEERFSSNCTSCKTHCGNKTINPTKKVEVYQKIDWFNQRGTFPTDQDFPRTTQVMMYAVRTEYSLNPNPQFVTTSTNSTKIEGVTTDNSSKIFGRAQEIIRKDQACCVNTSTGEIKLARPDDNKN